MNGHDNAIMAKLILMCHAFAAAAAVRSTSTSFVFYDVCCHTRTHTLACPPCSLNGKRVTSVIVVHTAICMSLINNFAERNEIGMERKPMKKNLLSFGIVMCCLNAIKLKMGPVEMGTVEILSNFLFQDIVIYFAATTDLAFSRQCIVCGKKTVENTSFDSLCCGFGSHTLHTSLKRNGVQAGRYVYCAIGEEYGCENLFSISMGKNR